MAQRDLWGARRHRMSSATGIATARPMHNAKNRTDVSGNVGSPVVRMGRRGDALEPNVSPSDIVPCLVALKPQTMAPEPDQPARAQALPHYEPMVGSSFGQPATHGMCSGVLASSADAISW